MRTNFWQVIVVLVFRITSKTFDKQISQNIPYVPLKEICSVFCNNQTNICLEVLLARTTFIFSSLWKMCTAYSSYESIMIRHLSQSYLETPWLYFLTFPRSIDTNLFWTISKLPYGKLFKISYIFSQLEIT